MLFRRRKKEKKKLSRKVKAVAAAAVLSTGVAVNQAFDPRDLVQSAPEPEAVEYSEPAPVSEADEIAAYTEEERMTRADKLRSRFLRLPLGVRAVVLLPLWAAGAVPTAIFTALTPLWRALLGLVLQMAVLLALFALVYKLLFPKAKLRQLFRPKNLVWLLLAAAALTALDLVLDHFWDPWPLARTALLILGGFGVICLLWHRLCGALKGPQPTRVRTKLSMEY